MKKILKHIPWNKLPLLAALLALWAGGLDALEIPLGRTASEGGASIAVVDMQTVFQEFPETLKAKERYYKELGKRREVLGEREQELTDLREQLFVLQTTIDQLKEQAEAPPPPVEEPEYPPLPPLPGAPADGDEEDDEEADGDFPPLPPLPTPGGPPLEEGGVGVSSASIVAVNESLRQRRTMLEEKELSLENEKKQAALDLKDLEEKRTLQIYGKLYRTLVQLAEEEGVSLVIDKSTVLYGADTVDLTEKLSRRIRGLPDE